MPLELKPGWTFDQKRTRMLLAQSGTRCMFKNCNPPRIYLYKTPETEKMYPNQARWMLAWKVCVISPDGVPKDINIVKSLHGKVKATW